MKKIILLVVILLLTQNFSFSQIELKGGLYASIPFGILVAGEYGLYDDIGIELGVVSNPGVDLGQTHLSGTAILVNARYYFSPNYGLDRFYAGVYIRPHTSVKAEEITNFFFPTTFPSTGVITPTSTNFEYSRDSGVGAGFLVGKKFVRKNKYFLDLNIGIGRNFGQRVYDLEVPSSIFGRRNERIGLDFFYSFVFGFRI
ncbi:MAG: hypothetical protein AB8F94_19985 [Saprospiraceae bacterium]